MCIVCIVCIVYIICTYRWRDLYPKYFFPPTQFFFPKTFFCLPVPLATDRVYRSTHSTSWGKSPPEHTFSHTSTCHISQKKFYLVCRYHSLPTGYTGLHTLRIQVYTLYIVREKPPRAYFFHTLHFSHTSTYPMSLFHIVLFSKYTGLHTLHREGKPPEHTFSHASTYPMPLFHTLQPPNPCQHSGHTTSPFPSVLSTSPSAQCIRFHATASA